MYETKYNIMINFSKYKLEQISKDETYTRYYIKGLKKAYYRLELKDEGQLEDFGGACGLIKSAKHEGYCILCMTYHKMESDELPGPGYMIEFSPLYDESGKIILIEYDRDEIFTSIDRGGYRKSWDSEEIVDATLTTWNNGAFEEWTEV